MTTIKEVHDLIFDRLESNLKDGIELLSSCESTIRIDTGDGVIMVTIEEE